MDLVVHHHSSASSEPQQQRAIKEDCEEGATSTRDGSKASL